MDKILLIESATDICAVAISSGDRLLVEVVAASPMVHTSKLTLMIEEVVKKVGITTQGLSAVAISRGPGSYTALRVGAATAKGICFGLDIPLIAVDTLQSISMAMAQENQETERNDRYFPMIDARRMEVYGAVFDQNQLLEKEHAAIILTKEYLEDLIPANGKLFLGGNGAEKCKQLTTHPSIVFTDIICSSRHLLPLAHQSFENQKFADMAYFRPFYLKPPNITKPKPIWR